MHQGRFSLILIFLLNATLKSTLAITGCIGTLINPNSVLRKVLCADPKPQIQNIPKNLHRNTDMLVISHQNISTVQEDDFRTITDLSSLFLMWSNLRKIHKKSFKRFVRLRILDLSGNVLTISPDSLPADIFLNLQELRHLTLTSNPLGFIPDLFFKPMAVKLQKVYLNNCSYPPLRISPRAFKDVYNIEYIDLRNSGIVSLLQPMETDFREMKSLKSLLISGNNFLCDCNLRWFYFYLSQIQENVNLYETGDKEVNCSGPAKLINKRFPVKDERTQLKYIDFVCSPKCKMMTPRVFIMEPGSSVNLTCECFTDPIQRLSWTKNGHSVEETANKYRLFLSGKETFQSTLNILSLQPLDSGNWTCRIEGDSSSLNFSLKVKSSLSQADAVSLNVYILVGVGSSLLLVSLVGVVVGVMFCRKNTLCHLGNQHPMVICGYETNVRKSSMLDGDIHNYRYNQQDGRFNTSFYENTIPFDSNISQYQRANHIFPDDLTSEKNFITKGNDAKSTFPKLNNEKMLNMYCGCNYNSEEEQGPEIVRSSSSCSHRPRQPKPFQADSVPKTAEEKFQQLKLRALMEPPKPCPFHGSSGTLTRIPGHKPCPVHGSTATLPSRLSSKKIEHRSGCPKHSKDNISVKSLKLEPSPEDHVKPHRCKSVSKLSTRADLPHQDKALSPNSYRPCPLHGDVLAAINENIFETSLKSTSLSRKPHSKVLLQEKSLKTIPVTGCDRSGRKSIEAGRNRGDRNTLTSPVQSSLSSSPLLTSDVHGTLV